jgi:predicted Zn-dependent peptidase
MRTMTLITFISLLAAALSAETPAKQTPPGPTAPRPFDFPKATSKTLPNGLRVYVVEDHRQPLVSATLQILAGNGYVAPEKSGLAGMTAGLLREGTATRTAQQLAKAVDNAGGNLSASAGDDVASVSMSFMKSYAGLGMELMADITRNPAFAQEEIDRQMRQAQSGLAVSYTNPEYLAPLAAGRAILGAHPYAYPGDGTPVTLRNIKRDDIVAFYKANYAPGRAWMAIAGDVTPAEGFALAEKHFGAWSAPAAADAKLPPPAAPKASVLIVDMPTAVQTQIVIGHVGVPRNHPDYLALVMANQIFGGSFNSRINMKLRANEGLTYGANSSFEPNRQAGMFQATTFTRTEKTADAIRMIMDLLKEFKENPATQAEFDEAKAYTLGVFGIATETSGAVAGRILTNYVYELPEDYWVNYRKNVQALTREQLVAALQKFLRTDQLTVVAVGNAKEFSKALEVYGPTRVIKGDDIDFTTPDLLKVKEKVITSAAGSAAARALIDQAIAAMGGLPRLQAIRDVSIKGKLKLTLPQGSFDATTEELILYPDRYKMVMTLPMMAITQVLDGTTGWMAQGAQVMDLPPNMAPELAKSIPTSAGGIGLLVAAATGKAEVNSLSEDSVLWKSAEFEVKMTFDKATHLPSKLAYKAQGMTGPAETESTLSDYREVDGLKVAHASLITQNGQKMGEGALTEVKFNPGASPDIFKRK